MTLTPASASSGGGGFDINILHREPMGELSSSEENNIWTISLKDVSTSFPIEEIKWSEDEEYMQEYDNKYEYILYNQKPRTYYIDCTVSNEYGSSTLEVVIRGKKS